MTASNASKVPAPDGNTAPGTAGESPYLVADEAAGYLRVSLKALYGLIERRKIVPLRPRDGRRLYFTRELLDEYVRGE